MTGYIDSKFCLDEQLMLIKKHTVSPETVELIKKLVWQMGLIPVGEFWIGEH